MSFYHCKHDVYFEDYCYYCEVEQKEKNIEQNYRKKCALGIVESLRQRAQDSGNTAGEAALKQAWEELNTKL